MSEKKPLSTYEEFIRDPEQKKLLESEYQELLLSELFLALMDEDQISVRRLAKAAGVSPTIIQELRAGKKDNLTLNTFSRLVESLGYSLILEKSTPAKEKTRSQRQRKIRFHLPAPRRNSRRKKKKTYSSK